MAISVMKLDVEGLQPSQHREADSARRNGPDIHALKIV